MILGRFIKQPLEVEVYSIQFSTDLSESDDATDFKAIILDRDVSLLPEIKLAPFTPVANGAYYTDQDVDLDTSTTPGLVSVANINQADPVVVTLNGDTMVLPAKHSALFDRSSGQWEKIASTQSILVQAPGDVRVRTFVSGGQIDSTYKVEVTISTQEGRTLQNEFLIKIKDT